MDNQSFAERGFYTGIGIIIKILEKWILSKSAPG